MAALLTSLDAWGDTLPDWVRALAEACEASSQNKVAQQLGYSGALVSNVLRNRYPGDLRAVENIVRGTLMAETVACPALGELSLADCQHWRRKSRTPTSGNSLDNRMARACRKCPINTKTEDAPHVEPTD